MPIQLSGSGSITGVSTLTSLASLDVTGSVSVGGTLVYDDVTNIDSLGIVTARSDVHVGAGLSVTGISTFNDYLDINGNININGDINIDGSQITYTSSSNQLKFADDASLKFGDGNDLQIYHNGNATYISNYNGTLFIDQEADNGTIALRSDNGSGSYIEYIECVGSSGEVRLYHYSDRKLTTKSTGIDVTGTITADGLDMEDDQKILLGTDDDLQIYHDGVHSHIREVGTGDLRLRSSKIQLMNENSQEYFVGTSGGSVELYYNDAKKFETTSTGAKVTGTLDLSNIDSSITDTATDIFVYDTRKDSDGGAWRKRTQHTSWYNETLNTSTRGSRREFPAVAVIVSDVTTDKVTIYDGDDPDLPMWMVISGANPRGILGWATANITSIKVTALNGILVAATNDGGTIFKFVEDFVEIMYSSANYNITSGRTIADRNNDRTYDTVSGTASRVFVIATYIINDVAMTVLPNAPIDDATGLHVPTIAVATDGGVSVIKDNGTVVDIERTSDDDVHHVDLDGDRVIMFMELGAIYVATIPHADQSGNPNSAWTVYGSYSANTSGTDYPAIQAYGAGVDLVSMKDHTFATAGYNLSDNRYKGLSILSEDLNFSGNGMVAWAHTDFNTGYMHGDIKGAFLSDTDTTNVTVSSAHYTETFTGSGDNTWGLAGGATMSGGVLTLADLQDSRATDLTAASSLTTGQKYIAEIEIVSNTSQVFNLDDDGAGAGVGGNTIYGSCGSGQTGTFLIGFTKTASPRMRLIRVSGGPATITSFKIYTAEEQDRSVNNNGLKVFGTITKTAVATGADLVAYSGFSGSNYLQQPYNSGLDFGTGDFSIMFWYKATAGDYTPQCFLHRGDGRTGTWGSGKIIQIEFNSTSLAAFLAESAFSSYDTVAIPGAQAASGHWQHYTLIRRGTFVGAYLDGELKDSTISNRDLSNTSAKTWIGERPNSTRPLDTTSLALLRISKSAPSDEQIKKIYNDEKHLYQENAKATLYGSSDAVTALGYDEDTELLHVGTSSGRSDFQGLRRINNTTTAVTTAISASDDLIAEQ